MQRQTCLQYKDAMEECNQNIFVFVFKQLKIKTNKCNTELDVNLQSGRKEFK